jgi:hypothetical protein
MRLPELPSAVDPVSLAGVAAIAKALRDPWLTRCRTALNDFLAITDQLLSSDAARTAEAMDRLVTAEQTLVDTLRSGAERQDRDETPRPDPQLGSFSQTVKRGLEP